jgi:superfamily I DNA/RNA helicase/RecB family exonuclease
MDVKIVGHGLHGASSQNLSVVRGDIPGMTTALRATVTEPADVLRPDLRGAVRIVGGPGTGKTSLLVAAAAAHIAAGTDPESVLLLTGSGRLAAATRSRLTAELLAARSSEPCRAVVREPLVRSLHSYAFAVLRQAAARAGDPPPRLVTGAEQDGIIRELLAGDLEDGDASASRWPQLLRPALSTAGFATELRDLLARCAERGVDPLQLQRIGRLSGRQEWAAAGRFAQQYEQVMLLRAAVGTAAPQATVPALGAAELVGAALEALASDAELLAAERSRVRLLLVDDAQHLDPQAARLVRVLAAGAELTLLAGDPNQAVFGFRGADPAILTTADTPLVELTRSHRCAPAVATAISGIAAGLPGNTVWRGLEGNSGDDQGSVRVRVAGSAHAEAALIADTLRRAHLVDGVPWNQLAVIVRSPSAAAALPRALAGAGVPVAAAQVAGPIADQPAAQALLLVLAATADGLDGEQAVSLLTGPIGRVDPVTLRQLRRALRRTSSGEFGDQLVAALTAGPVDLPATLARPVNRVRAVLTAAGRGHRRHRDPRYTLWQAWERSGLQRRWLTAAERGGTEGALAERNLEAVTALFDIADDYVSRTTGASLSGLLDHVGGLQLPPVRADSRMAEAVAVLSPHAALDRDWDLVVIAGLQDGLWPNTTPRGGVLGTQRLLDVLDGLGDDVSARAPLLAEERRLLIAAMGRARRGLLITAVDSDDGDDAALPSPFVAELAAHASADVQPAAPAVAPPVLAPAAVVGRLRAVVCAPTGSVTDGERATAAQQLARLAADGVAGADPAQWYGMTTVSTADPLWSGDQHTVTISPSTLQTLTDCPLRWLAERHGGTDPRDLRSTLGSVVHALIADSASSAEQLFVKLETLWSTLPFDSPWYADNELDRHRAMLAAFVAWRAGTRHELTEIGTEIGVDGVIANPGDDLPGVRVRGRVDRLERDAQGRLVIVDVKTGKSPVTKDQAQRHAQLGLYQLAVAEGALADGERPGGGRLVYVAKPNASGATEREQSALTPESTDEWRQAVRQAAGATAGPQFLARVNDGCTHCPMRAACPAHTAPRTEQ